MWQKKGQGGSNYTAKRIKTPQNEIIYMVGKFNCLHNNLARVIKEKRCEKIGTLEVTKWAHYIITHFSSNKITDKILRSRYLYLQK